MSARPLMIQGTASTCGKSLITAALCRILKQDGFRVAPFKAQNMSNNSFVTRNGLEMGRAQVVQAIAAGIEPDVRMNPVLIKPSSDTGAQVVLNGKPAFTMDAKNWHDTRERLRIEIRKAWESIAAEYECVILEGAGSPAEINLKKNDVVNMGMAAMADAPVILVGDIDRGGVFASLVGTMQLLDDNERKRVKGFIINKFRGDPGLLTSGLEQLEALTGVPVLGVVPWIEHSIDDEDGVSDRFDCTRPEPGSVDICIIRLPHISNFTDVIPLESVPGVTVRWCDRAAMFGTPDLCIIPGSKATISDLRTLKQHGIADAIINYARNGGTVLGICGGFQMLGTEIADPDATESVNRHEPGLGLLAMHTRFHPEKTTLQTTATLHGEASWLFSECGEKQVSGYEIHHGESVFAPETTAFTSSLSTDGSSRITGIASPTGRVLGSYLHGLFDSGEVTSGMINALRRSKNPDTKEHSVLDRTTSLDLELDRLAETVRNTCNLDAIYRILREWPRMVPLRI
ncbi:MAG: cobyric acid synthase [Chitinispirillaceae bacterium]|nr:cobyric acid synthase [Chitinispirillaceae bacterium]